MGTSSSPSSHHYPYFLGFIFPLGKIENGQGVGRYRLSGNDSPINCFLFVTTLGVGKELEKSIFGIYIIIGLMINVLRFMGFGFILHSFGFIMGEKRNVTRLDIPVV